MIYPRYLFPETAEHAAAALERYRDDALRSNPCNLPTQGADQLTELAAALRTAAARGEEHVDVLVADPLHQRELLLPLEGVA